MTTHFLNDSSTAEWLAEMRAIETEGDRSPVQTDPATEAADLYMPMLLRRQAA